MLEQLYQGLFSDGHFTGSFQDFQSKMEDPEYRKKLHAGIVDDGDFTGDYSTFENKFMGKTNGSADATPTGESDDMDLGSVDFSSELPEITSEITALGEKQGVARLNKMFKGLGWNFEEDDSVELKPGTGIAPIITKWGLGIDRVIAIAPPDKDGNRERMAFEFDLDFGIPAIGKSKNSQGDNEISGDFWESSAAWSTDIGAGKVAEQMNKFIRDNTNLEGVNEQTYNQAWNYAESLDIKTKDLSSEELQGKVEEVYTNLIFGEKKLPGVDRIFKEINTSLDEFSVKEINRIKNKYDTSTTDGLAKANKELKEVVGKEQQRLFLNSTELVNFSQGIEKALESRYGTVISDKKRREAEEIHLPSWVIDAPIIGDSDMFRQAYVTGTIKLPKAWQETQILHRGMELKKMQDELASIKDLDPNARNTSRTKDLTYGDAPTVVETNAERIETLQRRVYGLNKKLVADFASQQGYQKKLEDIKVPTAFGKTISDPDLTIDEWQGMLGDQIVQMISSVVSVGGSTYVQEAGGAALDIIEIEAAMKAFPVGSLDFSMEDVFGIEESQSELAIEGRQPVDFEYPENWDKMTDNEQKEWVKNYKEKTIKPKASDYEASLKAFRQLPEDDYVDDNGNKQLGRKSLMLDILNNGEANLTPAVVVGSINAGLDFGSSVIGLKAAGVIGKASGKAFSPTSFMRNILAADMKGIIRTGSPLALATAVETGTEVGQEVTSVLGVGVSTGYFGNDQKNLKRIFEAGAQAFLSTGPITGGSAVINKKINDIRAMKGDRATTRQAINELKQGINNAFKNDNLNITERNDFLEQLEEEENVINKYKEYKEMDVDQKTTVINENIKIRQYTEEITTLKKENEKLKKETIGGLNATVVKNKLKIEALEKKTGDANIKILQERRIINDEETRKYFVQHIKENPGLYNGAIVMDLGTEQKAREYFEKMGMMDMLPVQRLLKGEVNAFQLGKNVYSIKELRHKTIKKSATSGYGTSNAFHHDVLHVIQESMTMQELKEMWEAISKELESTKDPKLQKIWINHLKSFDIRYGETAAQIAKKLGKDVKKINKTMRKYYMEQMSNLSDAMNEYSLKDLTEVSAMDFGRIANYLSNVFHLKTKVGKNWANFGPENALEHIKEYTNFYGKAARLTLPKVRGKKDVDLLEKDKPTKEKPRYSDNKVPVKRETFTQNMDDGTKIKYRAITRLDGSVYFQVMIEGDSQFSAASKKLNIKAGENITPKQVLEAIDKDATITLDKTEGYKSVMQDKKWDRLTSEQQQRVDPKRAKQTEALESVTMYDDRSLFTPESLVDVIKSPSSTPTQKQLAEKSLLKDYDLLALNALGYDTRAGDIARENVLAEARAFFKGIVDRYDPMTSKFSTFVDVNLRPKRQQVYEIAKTKDKLDTVSLDVKEVKEAVDTTTEETTTTEDTFVQKIDVLEDFAITDRAIKDILKIVDVEKNDTAKDIIDKFAGPVGEIVFEIPAKKIMEGGANLTAVTKYTKGMPVPAEAQNIQRFFNARENSSKFLKSSPMYNVMDKTADIDKIGENIEVSRNVHGVAIGLKGLPLDYLMENFTDPRSLSENKETRAKSITSPSGRSKGLTSQTQVKKKKPEFQKADKKTVDKFKKDIGITPKNQPNIYNRDIGQLQKGFAKMYSINAALSAAQRNLAKKLAKLDKEAVKERKAIKQQIADITTAQSKAAFSEVVDGYIDGYGNVELNFEIEQKIINAVLNYHLGEKIHGFKDQKEIDNHIADIKKNIIPVLPGNVLTYNTFYNSDRHIGKTKNDIIVVDGKEMKIKDYYKREIKKLTYDGNKIGRGKAFTGAGAKYQQGKTYATLFGETAKDIKQTINKGRKIAGTKKNPIIMTVQEINEMNMSMHEQLWERVNKSIKDTNGKSAKVWANWFSTVSQNTEHPHRMGAELVGYSTKPKGYTDPKSGKFKLYEWEHAMPASRAYVYLMHSILGGLKESNNFKNYNFEGAYVLIQNNYKLIALDKYDDAVKLKGAGRTTSMGVGWTLADMWFDRYFDTPVSEIEGGIDPESIQHINGKTFGKVYNVSARGKISSKVKQNTGQSIRLNDAIKKARTSNYSEVSRGITVLDFDDTLATTKSLVKYTTPDGKTGTLNAEQYAKTYEDLLDKGYVFDFSDFNKVVKGKLAPLFNKAIKLQGKFGPENMFVLTARPPAAQKAIFDFLKANGLNIPLKNITGLGNSTAEAKALWIADKVSEGYNDFYFADDALQNVQAVKNMLDQFDVKSKVQQAKVNFSERINDQFNDILENVTGIESKKRFSAIKARKRGEKKGRFRFFIPPSHEDFVGLLYNFIGKGKEGNAHRDFFEKALIRPLNRAYRELNAAKQSIANDYKALNKQFENIKKKLTKKTPDGDFTYQDAIRVYLWNKHGHDISGLSETDKQSLVDLVMNDTELRQYAETLNIISKQDKYVAPTESWEAGDIRTDLDDATGRVGREQFFNEFNENTDIIFSQENLNKIEAAYGADVVSAIKDMLYRIKTGQNRPSGQNALVNKFLNYLNGSVASTMFFNIRSAVLQQMSMVNFINFADNNIIAAAKAFANQKQYWADWATIFNSDFMKQRRKGIQTDVNGAELAASVKNAKNPIQAVIKKLLELGFLPTQIGDNIAIATGGATFLRNRINTYLKQGLSQKEAEAKAFVDFEILAEATQQSARPDMVSQQQASPLGKVILAFQNVTSQFNRLGKKAFLDFKNRRITPGNQTQLQSDMSNLSRIAYYFAIQNLIFYSLQSALFMAMFDDDEEDERWLKKKERMINGSIDSVLRGTGVWGAVVATLKNMAIKWHEQREKGYNADESAVLMEMLNVSPPLGIKARKLVNAEKELNYNKKVIDEMETFDIDNPQWSAYTNYIESATNIPLNRLYNKTQNVRESLDNQHSALERALMFSGWSKWNLGIGDSEKIKKIKENTRKKKKKKGFGEKTFQEKTFQRKSFN